MGDRGLSASRSRSIGVSRSSSQSYDQDSAIERSPSRSFSTARLASPLPASTPPARQIPNPRNFEPTDSPVPLAGVPESQSSLPGPRQSSLSQAIRQSYGHSPPRFGTPPVRGPSPIANQDTTSLRKGPRSNYGSFDQRSNSLAGHHRSPSRNEDIEAVRRHLAGPSQSGSGVNLAAEHGQAAPTQKVAHFGTSPATAIDHDEFSSLQLQGDDITRHIYKYTEDREREQREEGDRREGRLRRSLSMNAPHAEHEDKYIANLKKPGGMRREYITRTAESPAPSSRIGEPELGNGGLDESRKPQFVANNFIEFLTLYGHFAGEEFDEDDEVLGPDEYFSSDAHDGATDDEDRGDREYGEDSALLTPGAKKRRRKQRAAGQGSPRDAVLLLLKSFVGTGVLFLPRAFLNGGMLFSNLVLLGIAGLSFWCFVLLVTTRLKVHASFGDMGGRIYGKHFRNLINSSLVLSQVGFTSAYIVFVSENLQAFVSAVSNCTTFIDIKWFILIQMLIFLPISLYRNINNIQKLALIADLFILLGLVYLYFYDVKTIVANHGIADINNFNRKDWTLFIGTAIFTFEGIGLIIPIQSGMKDPTKFPRVLGFVMVIVTVIFVSMGALSYAAFGSSTRTVVLLNLPQDDKMVNAVQFIYSLAILFSVPLQIFPAVEISSLWFFNTRTGKYNPWIKWKKNVFRFAMVVLCAGLAWAGADDLDKFVSLVGSFACIPLVYIYPPLMHYKVAAPKRWQKVADIVLVIIGVIGMGYTTALTIVSWLDGSTAKAPGYCDER